MGSHWGAKSEVIRSDCCLKRLLWAAAQEVGCSAGMEAGSSRRRLLRVFKQTMSEAWTKMIAIKLLRKEKEKEGRKVYFSEIASSYLLCPSCNLKSTKRLSGKGLSE